MADLTLYSNMEPFIGDIKRLVEQGRNVAYGAVNAVMIETYWRIGQRIVEQEQKGKERADYGTQLIEMLSQELTRTYGKGFSGRYLRAFRHFYLVVPDIEIWKSRFPNLTWTHIFKSLRVADDTAIRWYLEIAATEAWSVRTLDRNIATQYYERHFQQPQLPSKNTKVETEKAELIKSPIIAEFLGFRKDVTLPILCTMKAKTLIFAAVTLLFAVGCTEKSNKTQESNHQTTDNMENTQKESVVYLTKDISPEGLVNIYKALGVPVKGRVAIKMSTGEGSNPNYLKPELIKNLVFEVDGTIVECNTAYGNGPGDEKDDRNNSANHWKVIERHGFTPTFKVDIMDEEGEMRIPVQDSTHLKYDIVGDHMANYDFMIALNHFKGHPMGGYGGALKNLSIGCASQNGKAYIHSSGKMEVLDMAKLWTQEYIGDQDGFLESMAAAAQAVVDYFQKKEGIIYINVMNNMSIDCDCVDHPAPVKLEDYGILASTDPVALDQACVDIINNQEVTATNDPTDLLHRIDKQHGVHTIEHAEAIGLGSRKYTIVNIDN